MKISQSFVKEYSKYKQKKSCGLQVKAKYIDGIKFPSSDTMELGNYFEFMATGCLPRSGEIPTPEIVYKGTAKEKLSTDEVKMSICLELGISYLTFRRWLKSNHSNLTKIATINAICKVTDLTEEEIFETELNEK